MIRSSTRLVGHAVVDPRGDELGRIDRIMVELASGRIAYAVLAYGGVFGIGERLCAIPWRELRLDPQRCCFVLHRPPGDIEDCPLSRRVGLS